ncbi:MAG: energy transducer TonB [Gammaproteobacteria bacterium]|nr:energy transducer TonB [Gammaproteobacteria bacterium]
MSKYLLISISIHATLFAIIFKFMFWQIKAEPVNTPIITIYTLHTNKALSEPKISKISTPKKDHFAIQSSNPSKQEQELDQLKIIIHSLFKNRLKYPNNIRFPAAPKKVTAALVVFPDGHTENIRLLKSSGFAIFDREVLEAAYSLPPLKEARSIIKKPTELEIPIEFL